MHNPVRGEVEVVLDGKAHVLRPTFQAICELEQAVGCGIVALVRRLHDGDIRLHDVVAVLECGMRGAGESVPVGRIGESVLAQGIRSVMPAVVGFLQSALGAEQEAVAHG